MKAIVVTDQAAGTAGMTLVERPEPQAAINDVVVQVHASGYRRLQSDQADQREDDHPRSSVSDTRSLMHAGGQHRPDRPVASYQPPRATWETTHGPWH